MLSIVCKDNASAVQIRVAIPETSAYRDGKLRHHFVPMVAVILPSPDSLTVRQAGMPHWSSLLAPPYIKSLMSKPYLPTPRPLKHLPLGLWWQHVRQGPLRIHDELPDNRHSGNLVFGFGLVEQAEFFV